MLTLANGFKKMLLHLEMCPDFHYLLPFAVADR